MDSPNRSTSHSSSPYDSTSPSSDSFSLQNDPQPLSPNNQKNTDHSTTSLARVLAERADVLPLCMFGGLVDASSNLTAQQKEKQKLTWIKVEPGANAAGLKVFRDVLQRMILTGHKREAKSSKNNTSGPMNAEPASASER
ncbi:hypothetical protein AYO22_10908 [Fonsecaea multimorphosa]|nr:hypothetical protein AYO22_10908 [Fonsecaea multimorphosa]